MNSKIDIFTKFGDERNLRMGTLKSYISAVQKFEYFLGRNIDNIIQEAINEEKEGIAENSRLIKKNLLDYRLFLIESDISPNTVKTYFSKLKTFLKHFGVEVPTLPEAKYDRGYETCYLDLPNKKHISQALDIVSIDMKAIILFMASSGTAKAETLSLTVDDFFRATSDYHDGGTPNEILNELSKKKNIIPTFYLKRIKTDKYYYTFCSPEATRYIVEYLGIRKNLSATDKLFDFSDSGLLSKFQYINDKMGWGFKGKYRFFRSHSLRKFHVSNIGLVPDHVDELQGRSRTPLHETYIKTNPIELKKLYEKVVDNVTILNDKLDGGDINEEFYITINVFLSDNECKLI